MAERTRVFELDLPEVLQLKEHVLTEHGAAATCQRRTVGIGLREDWLDTLIEVGLRVDEPTAWLAEGLLAYLARAEAIVC